MEQAPAVKKVENAIHPINLYPAVDSAIGPLQLVIHVVQNRRAGEQKSHWDKKHKANITKRGTQAARLV